MKVKKIRKSTEGERKGGKGGRILKILSYYESLISKTLKVNEKKAIEVKIKIWKIGKSTEVGGCGKKWEGVVGF